MTKAGAMIIQEIDEAIEKQKESIIMKALKKGKTVEEISDFIDIPIGEIEIIKDKMLVSESI